MEITVLGVFTGFIVVLWGLGMRLLSNEIKLAVREIEQTAPVLSLDETIKQELYDLLTLALDDTVGQMNIPSWKDHLFGAAMPFLQNKLMGSVPQQARNIIEGVADLSDYGQETREEETHP